MPEVQRASILPPRNTQESAHDPAEHQLQHGKRDPTANGNEDSAADVLPPSASPFLTSGLSVQFGERECFGPAFTIGPDFVRISIVTPPGTGRFNLVRYDLLAGTGGSRLEAQLDRRALAVPDVAADLLNAVNANAAVARAPYESLVRERCDEINTT